MDAKRTVLIVGEDPGVSRTVRTLGFRPMVVGGRDESLRRFKGPAPSLVLVNLPTGAVEPRWLHALLKQGGPILVLTDSGLLAGDVDLENERIQVLPRPVPTTELQVLVRNVLKASGEAQTSPPVRERYLTEYAPLFDHSPKMRAIREMIEQIIDTNTAVLIRGETGVGKDLVARAIHYASPRCGQHFEKVNCAALPAELLESELFGHEKGAFTGAYRRKLGKFEYANKGTLFLDEIGELPLPLQAKLLQVLQDHEFYRVGGRELIRVDIRVIASTNRNLELALANGEFREDLYYRLDVVEIHVPPLRERREEIPVLVSYFLQKFRRQYNREIELLPEAMTFFVDYLWPGNVRELENIIRRLVVLGSVRQAQEEILAHLRNTRAEPAGSGEAGEAIALAGPPDRSLGLREIARLAAREAERRAIQAVLERVRWNRTKAASLLSISYKTLLTKIAVCGLAPK